MKRKLGGILKKLFIWGLIVSMAAIIVSEVMVKTVTKNHLYNSISEVPHKKVGLLLGTARWTLDGRKNLYYQYRINAAVELFNAKKIDYILVSGDNGTKYYDEPSTIKKDLIARGIPKNRIVLDYAGFRTLDSVVRANKVFVEDDFMVISQPFHNERAVFIAKAKGIKAIGYNARRVTHKFGIKVQIRERFARVKMMLDLIFGVQPKFLGDKIVIGG